MVSSWSLGDGLGGAFLFGDQASVRTCICRGKFLSSSVGSKNDGGSAFALCLLTTLACDSVPLHCETLPPDLLACDFVPLHCETNADGTAEREIV